MKNLKKKVQDANTASKYPTLPPNTPHKAYGILKVLRKTFIYWRPYWLLGILVFMAMLLQEGFITFFDVSLQNIVDNALSKKNGALLITIFEQLSVGFMIATCGTVAGDYLSAKVNAHILNDLRLKMFNHLQNLSMKYFSHSHTGDTVARFTSDLTEIEKGMTTRFTDGNTAIAGLMLNVPVLFILQWRLALLTIFTIPIVCMGASLFAPLASKAYYHMKNEQGSLAASVQENVRAQSVIKIFGLETTMITRFQSQLESLFHRSIKATFLSSLVGTSSSLSVRLVQVLIIGFGSWLAFHRFMSIGGLIAFIALHKDVCQDIYNLSKKVVPSLIAAGGGLQRIEELLNEQPEIVDSEEALVVPRISSGIYFKDVSFSYAADKTILDRVNLVIPARNFVAFVGPSGAGKTTIFNLLTRFYDTTCGEIFIDDLEMRSIKQESLRSQMAAVFQETFLFNSSIEDNIRLGKIDATIEDIEEAAKAAEIHDAIMNLPKRYKTIVGECGSLLSGGQRQRIAIARAILRDPAVLLLDEATTGLDAPTEAAIMSTVERLSKGRTVVSITHRLASVQHADHIFVVEAGTIREQGCHQELMSVKGTYYLMWQKQQEFRIVADDQSTCNQYEGLASQANGKNRSHFLI